jgi:hypothetical protein
MGPGSTAHPTEEVLRAFGEGRLAPGDAADIEEHLAGCDSCCRLLEATPGDSFVEQLRAAGRSSSSTTADHPPVAEHGDLPEELIGHPRYRVVRLLGRGGGHGWHHLGLGD